MTYIYIIWYGNTTTRQLLYFRSNVCKNKLLDYVFRSRRRHRQQYPRVSSGAQNPGPSVTATPSCSHSANCRLKLPSGLTAAKLLCSGVGGECLAEGRDAAETATGATEFAPTDLPREEISPFFTACVVGIRSYVCVVHNNFICL